MSPAHQMVMSDIKRNKDAGIPGNGGKFAPDAKEVSEVPLPPVPTREEAEERARLRSILSERMGQEEVDDFGGYEHYDFHSEVEKVADAVSEHYYGKAEGVEFASVSMTEGDDGGYYTVSARPSGTDYNITREWSMKYATDDREATGEDAAIAIAANLDADMQRIIADAQAVSAQAAAAKNDSDRDGE